MSTQAALVPVNPAPRCPVNVRRATANDLAFIDALQRMHTHMVGWFPRKQVEGYLKLNGILIAEDEAGTPLGYCIFRDTYSGRDDVGIVYQLNVMPLKQRHLVGAALVKAAFEHSAYGVKLFCCWCAQDINANFFWEAIGFVPLAFRTGTRTKQRTHIFWQKRVREGDTTTPWWYPSQTKSGSFREGRLAFPIPAHVHWRDPMPLILPQVQAVEADAPKTLPGGAPVSPRPQQPKLTQAQKVALQRSQNKLLGGAPLGKMAVLTGRGIKYVDRPDHVPETDTSGELAEKLLKPKRPARAPAAKHDAKQIDFARELRDRYLDEVNANPALLPGAAKYDVARALPAPGPADAPTNAGATRLLPAA